MDLINWSLSAIDTIFSTRSLGSGEPVCPDGTFAAGYTRDAWERWQIVCLAALSVEDAEDIYLFGTMITGILLFGLGVTLGYRKIQKTGTAVQSLTRLPVLIEAVGRAVSNETETINRNMDTIMMKLTALEVKFGDFRDQNGQREWAALCSCSPQSHNNLILSFLAPRTGALAKAVWITTLWERWSVNLSPPSPDYGHYSPPPFNCLCNALYRHLSSRSETGAETNGTGPDGCLPELDMFPMLQVMCLWYMCFCAEVFFSVLRLYSKWSIVWGLKNFFFPPLSPHVKKLYLSKCSVYPVVICMLCMYGQVDG